MIGKHTRTLFTAIVLLPVLFVAISCGTNIRKVYHTTGFHDSFTATYGNMPLTTQGAGEATAILSLLGIQGIYPDSVTVQLKDNKLLVSWNDGSEGNLSLTGNMSRRGYYQYFLKREKLVVPVFYSRVDVNRLRFYVSGDSTMVIDQFVENSANIFLLAAGARRRTQFVYRK